MGAGCLNLVVAELVFAAGLLLLVLLTWPEPPWDTMLYAGILVMIVTPILFFTPSTTISTCPCSASGWSYPPGP